MYEEREKKLSSRLPKLQNDKKNVLALHNSKKTRFFAIFGVTYWENWLQKYPKNIPPLIKILFS